MSNTIRRKNASYDNRQLEDTRWAISKYGGLYLQDYQLEGKERHLAIVMFQKDDHRNWNHCSAPKSYRKMDHRRYRTKCKIHLSQLYKDTEYEVQIYSPKWPYWN